MAEYERSKLVQAAPDDVFAFVANVNNLATFLPTVSVAEPEGEERVRVRGATHGRAYEDDGWFHVEEARHRLEWGSAAREYAGWLTVAAADGGTRVVAHLSLPPYVTPSGAPISGEAEGGEAIEQRLEAALDSLRNLMEGTGGKVEAAG